MFICEDCHDKSACQQGFIEGLMRSRGACEQCGTVSNCLDCHGYKNVPLTYEERRILAGLPAKDVVQEVGAIMKTVRYDDKTEAALTEDSRIDPNPGGEDYPWPTDTTSLGAGNDYVTCGAFLSMHHPLRRKTGTQECLCLILVSELPKACPQCGQWKS